MNDFQFQNTTKVYFGKDQLGHLHAEVLKYGKEQKSVKKTILQLF